MSKPKILYLEDDFDLGEITSILLEKKGFEVIWVVDGVDGLEVLKEQSFDLVVADIMMPKLDGYSLLKQIREDGNTIPLILLSARVLTEDVLQGFSLGADDYIRKPFSVEELTARIKRLLIRNFPAVDEHKKKSIVIGDYEYDPESYKLIHKKRMITLSPRSGEILYRLVTSENRMLPRKETLIELWGDDSFFNGRSLDVFISKLRKNLSEDSKISIINIRAQGYRLIID
ncbi:response regulator transcription factor [Flavobacterium lipolyticum]|uniref:Response regulator transcription factor n=1 Tax=Flavobacterium lipolyticum TaxID=2893754 RepID=A0ABS8M4L5_9FLAO|nr:response regulator transcription factor [Flavobacterium sp. F-126]MCC9019178.1 response regulator transcription factor [Flavobacterium sp. F-126]